MCFAFNYWVDCCCRMCGVSATHSLIQSITMLNYDTCNLIDFLYKPEHTRVFIFVQLLLHFFQLSLMQYLLYHFSLALFSDPFLTLVMFHSVYSTPFCLIALSLKSHFKCIQSVAKKNLFSSNCLMLMNIQHVNLQ